MNPTRTPLFLMANLGAEVSRIFSALERGEAELAQSALVRAQNMISQVVQFPEMQTRLAEINTLSRVLSEMGKEEPVYQASRENLESYFQPFALRLLAQR